MPDRLSALDASFLSMESATTPMHVGGLMTFDPPPSGPLDPGALVALIASRIGLVPCFRQKVRFVPGGLGHPVWVDDPDFDLAFHVRTSALPRPGTHQQLLELVGRLQRVHRSMVAHKRSGQAIGAQRLVELAGLAPPRDMYPVVPLAAGQTVAVGVTSFDGGVFVGINADRDAVADVDVLAAAVPDALGELLATT